MPKPPIKKARFRSKTRDEGRVVLLRTEAAATASAGFTALTAARRQQLANDLAVLVSHVGQGAGRGTPIVEAVDFPKFVADLLNGVFDSIVGSSIEQMDAYARLVADVAKSAESFAQENTSVASARDSLAQKFPQFVENENDHDGTLDRARRKRVHARRSKTPGRVSTAMLLAAVALKAASAAPPR